MAKTLKVIKPFYIMQSGDIFELTDDGNYTSKYNEEYNQIGDSDTNKASYTSTFIISQSLAKDLINKGFLSEEAMETPKKSTNVFDEMDRLSEVYKQDLKEAANDPFDLQKQTVLTNLLNLINYLKSLKH